MENLIWYKRPPNSKYEEFMIGNGSFGGCVRDGYLFEAGVYRDTVFLNTDTLWYGKHRHRENPQGLENLDKIRRLLFEEKYAEAEELMWLKMTSVPKYFGAYLPLGRIDMLLEGHSELENYKRSLSLDEAVAKVEYDAEGAHYTKEYFVSKPREAMVIHIESDKPIISMMSYLMRRPYDEDSGCKDGCIYMTGQCGEGGVRYACMAKMRCDGEWCTSADILSCKGALSVDIFVVAATDFYGDDPLKLCEARLSAIDGMSYGELLNEHVEDFKTIYNANRLNLFGEESTLPIDERVKRYKSGEKDLGLVELFYNFSKYLLVSSSREGSETANLQGIWSWDYAPPCECNYTVNINTQMNYWPADVCNLSGLQKPLFELIKRAYLNGKKTARDLYGCEGFVMHHCTNLWGDTAPESVHPPAVMWPMGAAWLVLHMWEHYRFSCDVDFLKNEAYELMRESAIFFTQYMVEDEDGWLVTGPTSSPEHCFFTKDGSRAYISMGVEMDNQIVRELFSATISAANILGVDDVLKDKLSGMLERIRTPRITRHGTVLEWYKEYEDVDIHHRHLSALFALYPGTQISPEKDPELAEACRKTLERRLGKRDVPSREVVGGWTYAWASCLYARLYIGERAYDNIEHILKNVIPGSIFSGSPLLFQIDVHSGVMAAVAEMLIQSHTDTIRLLPALPCEWAKGRMRNLRARGGYSIDIAWENGGLTEAELRASEDGICRISAGEQIAVNTKSEYRDGVLEFEVKKSGTYIITPANEA